MTYHAINADARATGLPDAFFHCVATSPPYFGLREYGDDDREIGDEKTPSEYVAEMVNVGREVRRVMRDDGVWWLNLGDSYAKSPSGPQGVTDMRGVTAKPIESRRINARIKTTANVPSKSLLMIPQRVALALQDDGWIIRAQIPWVKGSAMPESVRDRPTVAHEYVFMLVKQQRYFWDPDAVRMPHAAASLDRYEYGLHKTRKDGAIEGSVADRQHAGMAQSERMGDFMQANGRNIRTSDFFHAGLDELQSHIAHVRENGGMMLSDEDDPLAFLVNPVGSKLAHFAMWPPKLVKPMILSSTSEKGCCPKCGAQWVRIVEKHGGCAADTTTRRVTGIERVHESGAVIGNVANPQRVPNEARGMTYKTLGFSPSCGCNVGDPVPCRVLDPFAGSGTTLQVCESLNRDSWGVELMAKNIPIIAERMKEKLDPETMKRVVSKSKLGCNVQRSIFEDVA